MNPHSHRTTNEFLDIMYQFKNVFPLITRPTRITSNTAMAIDNIFTNDLNNCCVSGLMFSDITDHLPIFLLPDQRENSSKTTWLFLRDWNDMFEFNDPNHV